MTREQRALPPFPDDSSRYGDVAVVVSSSFPENLNVNISIPTDLAEGFNEVLGSKGSCVLSTFRSLQSAIERYRPKLLILVGSALSSQSSYSDILWKARKGGCVTAFWTVEDPYEFDYRYKYVNQFDFIFSNDILATGMYDCPRVFHLPTAASRRLKRELGDYDARDLDVFFCGVGFANRQRLFLDALRILELRNTQVWGERWPVNTSPIFFNRRIPTTTLHSMYANSKIVLNLGRDYDLANSERRLQAVTPGPRTFEAAMVGCVQLYHNPSYHLEQYFSPGKEILTFRTVHELKELLHEGAFDLHEMAQVAADAQARCLQDHTYAARAQSIMTHVGLDTARAKRDSRETA